MRNHQRLRVLAVGRSILKRFATANSTQNNLYTSVNNIYNPDFVWHCCFFRKHNKQRNKQTNKQTKKETNKQTNKQATKQTNKTSKQTKNKKKEIHTKQTKKDETRHDKNKTKSKASKAKEPNRQTTCFKTNRNPGHEEKAKKAKHYQGEVGKMTPVEHQWTRRHQMQSMRTCMTSKTGGPEKREFKSNVRRIQAVLCLQVQWEKPWKHPT